MKKNRFLQVGRICFYAVLFYLFALPFLAVIFLSIVCGNGGTEYCGVRGLLFFPHIELIFNTDFFVSFAVGRLALISMISLAVMFGAKWLLRQHLKFELGFHWTLISSLILSVVFGILFEAIWWLF